MGLNEQLATLIERYCVHLPRWRSHDPIARLRAAKSERDLLAIFARLGDLHTHCELRDRKVVWLPFAVSECDEGVIVTASLVDGIRRGDMLLKWNGLPVEREIRASMARQLGANRVARRAKAVQTLTFRLLSTMPPPEGDAATITLSNGRTISLPWRIDEAGTFGAELAPLHAQQANFHVRDNWIRISSFHEQPGRFMASFRRALEQVPEDGVVLDLRGCDEGIIQTAEQLLQLFADRRIEPERFRFRRTEAMRALIDRSLPEWRDAFARGRAQPLTSADEANGVGRCYRGPLIVLVDALTYSSSEMFAAGVQDHGIGIVVGTAARTGGGGASPWSQAVVARLSGDTSLAPLPGSPDFRVAVRRAERVLRNEGRPIERVGVVPDVVVPVERADLLDDERNLRQRIGRILAELRRGR